MVARCVCYIFAGYVVACFAICVVIFGIPLAAVSAAEMILVYVISNLWIFVLLFAVVSTREMHFWFISKREYDNDNERMHNNHNCDDDKIYQP